MYTSDNEVVVKYIAALPQSTLSSVILLGHGEEAVFIDTYHCST